MLNSEIESTVPDGVTASITVCLPPLEIPPLEDSDAPCSSPIMDVISPIRRLYIFN